jgi:serine/threonine protein kinase
MEYCEGGDLFTKITSGNLTSPAEYNCYFKQLILGVQYLHSMGVAHRDLKPENLLLDKSSSTLKITDFGVSEVFRAPFTSCRKLAHGLCGSGPYIAPEEYTEDEYDSESVDIWAMGIIYFVMSNSACPWRSASITDARYQKYLDSKGSYYPIERMSPGPRKVMYELLNPNPKTRVGIKSLLEDEWVKGIRVCVHEKKGDAHDHSHDPSKL